MQLVTRETAAEILSVSLRTIDNLIKRNELPRPKSIGRRVYWTQDQFEEAVIQLLNPEKNKSTPKRRGRPRKQK